MPIDPILPGVLTINLTAAHFEAAGRRLSVQNLELVADLSRSVKKWAKEAQAQAVRNVSGGSVTYSGGTFTINRQSGKLARSIQITYPSLLSAVVTANAEYAAAIEAGVPYPVDLKPFLMGKTVFIPFTSAFGNRSTPIAYPVQTSSQGGNNPQDPGEAIGKVKSIPQYNSKGGSAGNKMGIFRRIGPNTQGFIIPPRAARPFMAAAAEAIGQAFQDDVVDIFRKHAEEPDR